jgi:hypothetical protein
MHQALRTADWRSIGALTLILGVTAAVYAGSLDNDFVHDDWASVANNESLKGLGNLGRFFVEPALFAQGGPSSHTRPVLLVTFAINRAIADDAFGFRLVNLLIHLINVVLLYLLVGRVLRLAQVDERVAGVRLLTAAIFAVHPLNTQAVVYVSSRSALLAFTFIVAGMLLFLKWPHFWDVSRWQASPCSPRSTPSRFSAPSCFSMSVCSRRGNAAHADCWRAWPLRRCRWSLI